MNEQMSLEDYKKEVEECLLKKQNCSIQAAKKLMKGYEQLLPEYLKLKLTPTEMSAAMVMGF